MKASLILHPLSFSAGGKAALAQAVSLARWYRTDLHVFELRGQGVAAQDPIVRSINDPGVDPRVAEFVKSAGCVDVQVSAVELDGDVIEAVVDHAKRTSADLLVVASHALSHGPYWRSGAYAYDIARRIACPTLAVPMQHKVLENAPFSNILCPIDLSPDSITGIQVALNLAEQGGAKVTFVHVQRGSGLPVSSPDAKSAVEEIAERVTRAIHASGFTNALTDTIVVPGVALRVIVQTARAAEWGLIVMSPRRSEYANHVAMTSITASVLRRTLSPVLVVPSPIGDTILLSRTHRQPVETAFAL